MSESWMLDVGLYAMILTLSAIVGLVAGMAFEAGRAIVRRRHLRQRTRR